MRDGLSRVHRRFLSAGIAAVLSMTCLASPAFAGAPTPQPPTSELKGDGFAVDARQQRANADAALSSPKARLAASYQDEYIAIAGPAAQAVQSEYDIPSSVTAGQSILESNWGRSGLSVNDKNYFGFKCVTADNPGPIAISCHAYETQECTPDCHTVTAYFRVYRSVTDSYRDYGRLITTSANYASALPYRRSDPDQFIREVAKKYATDPQYADKVIGLMQNYTLYRFNSNPVQVPTPVTVPVTTLGTDGLQLIARATTAQLFQKTYTPATNWRDWAGIDGSTFVSSAPALQQYNGSLYLFVIGSSGHLMVKVQDPTGAWGAWTDLGGSLDGIPSVVQFGDELHVFARSVPSIQILEKVYKPTTGWGGWNNLGGVVESSPAAVVYGSDLNVFAVGSPNKNLFQKVYNATAGWGDWGSLGGYIDGTPSVTEYRGELHIFNRAGGGNNQLFEKAFRPGTGWVDWAGLGGYISPQPLVTKYQDGLHIFALGAPTGPMYQKVYNPTTGTWSDWFNQGGSLDGTVTALTYGTQLHLFGVGTPPGRAAYQKVFNPATGGWSDWFNQGGILG